VVIPTLAASTDGHNTRDLNFSLDGKLMFVSVGSAGNLAENMPKKTPEEATAWNASKGLGAAWGHDENRADVLVSDPAGKGLRVYAAGIRNCSGQTIQPKTGQVWCSTNERDLIGDDLVPDYATHVQQGAFYGWPWYYMGSHEDPREAGLRPDLNGKVTVPDILIQPHSAAVQIRFYDGKGPNAFPAQYQNGAFIALHGSWNRAQRTGYKLVFAPMTPDGKATGEYVDFMTGVVLNDSDVWARPYGVTVAHDGALLVSDDANGQLWRITPAK
jgi:glucose/arabinose dehydrogenase